MKTPLISIVVILLIKPSSSVKQRFCASSSMETVYAQAGTFGEVRFNNEPYLYSSTGCSVEIVACTMCSVNFTIEANPCRFAGSLCPCGVVTIRETGYKTFNLCDLGEKFHYEGLSDSVMVIHDSFMHNSSVVIRYSTQKNQDVISGSVGIVGNIFTPWFPKLYSPHLRIEHTFLCSGDCIVTLLFTDFLIAPSSVMEVIDSDGTLLKLITGSKSRPPFISSTGSSMTVRFSANGGSHLGYKAKYSFINTADKIEINTDCGGEIRNLGGYIYMYDLAGYYDCFWIIKPNVPISYMKSHLSMKILNFTGNAELQILNGITSESKPIATVLNDTVSEFETSISKGYYIALKGYPTKVLISYAAFSYVGCMAGLDFVCRNNRCIMYMLACDSIDHCGDNSDENNDCMAYSAINQRFWWPMRNGQAFNDDEQIVGLWIPVFMILIAALFFMLAVCHRSVKIRPVSSRIDVEATNDQIRTIAQLLSDEDDANESDDPPPYEQPPDYNQVIMQTEQKKPKKTIKPKPSTSYIALEPDVGQAPNLNFTFKRRSSDSSIPISGYDDDLGISTTLPVTASDNLPKRWTRESLETGDSASPNISAVSFDTLRSSQEECVRIGNYIKSHSQDDLLNNDRFHPKLKPGYKSLL